MASSLAALLAFCLLDGSTRLLARRAGGSLLLLLAAITASAVLLLWLLFLGAIGSLRWPWIAAGALVFWSVGWRAARTRRRQLPLARIAARLVVLLLPRRRGVVRPFAAWACVLAVVLCLFQALRVPNLAYDAVSYHLPFTAAVVASGTVPHVDTPFGDNAQAYQPKNDDLLRAALVPVAGSERLAWIGSFPHLPLFLLAVYVAARALGVRRTHALLGACATTISFELFAQAKSAQVDLALASWWSAFVALLLAGRRRGDAGCALGAGAALGLAYGTKYLAVPYTPLAAVVAGVALRAFPRGSRLRSAGALLVGLVATGAFFYVRNWVLAGSPLFPIRVAALGLELLPGDYGSTEMRAWEYRYADQANLPLAARLAAFLWPLCGYPAVAAEWLRAWPDAYVAASLALPAALWCLAAGAAVRRGALPALVALLVPAALALCWYVVPYTYGRFALPALAAYGITVARLGVLTVPATLVQCALCWSGTGWRGASEACMAFALAAPLCQLHLLTAARRARVALLWLLALLPPVLAVATPGRSDQALLAEAAGVHVPALRRGVEFLLAQRDGDQVAYAGNNVPYLARGTGARVVEHVPSDGRGGVRYDQRSREWHAAGLPPALDPEPGFYRRVEDPRAWLAALQRGGSRWLWVTRLHGPQLLQVRHDLNGFPAELAWALAAAPALEIAYADEESYVFVVHPARAPAAELPAPTLRSEPDALGLLGNRELLAACYPLAPALLSLPQYARIVALARARTVRR